MPDNQIGYEFAGPGRKRRERLAMQEIADTLAPKKDRHRQREDKPKSRTEETSKREERDLSVPDLENVIRKLTLQTETFKEVCDEMKRDNIGASPVLISAVRTDMRATVKFLIREGLIDKRKLERYRREHQRKRDR